MAGAHPGLRLVDFVSFAGRARRLLEGQDLVHPLYPVGYPALLLATQAVVGEVLVAGKALAVLAGVGAVAAVGLWLGPWAALFLAVQQAMLVHGATEGTDMPAVALALAALAAADRGRGATAGGLLGAALLCRYTAVAAVPVVAVLVLARGGLRSGLRCALAAGVATAPHWAVALWTGASVWPDQSHNLAIGAGGRPTPLLSVETLVRLPAGMGRGLVDAASAWPVRLGAVGLLVGLIRRDRRAAALLAYGALHLVLIGVAFSRPRLVLPVTLVLACGGAWLLVRWWLAVPAAIVAAVLSVPAAWAPSTDETSAATVVALVEGLEGPFVSGSPWFAQPVDGWLDPGIPLQQAGDPRRLQPEPLAQFCRARGVAHVVLEVGRVRRNYRGLEPLLSRDAAPGFTRVAQGPGWVVVAVE